MALPINVIRKIKKLENDLAELKYHRENALAACKQSCPTRPDIDAENERNREFVHLLNAKIFEVEGAIDTLMGRY